MSVSSEALPSLCKPSAVYGTGGSVRSPSLSHSLPLSLSLSDLLQTAMRRGLLASCSVLIPSAWRGWGPSPPPPNTKASDSGHRVCRERGREKKEEKQLCCGSRCHFPLTLFSLIFLLFTMSMIFYISLSLFLSASIFSSPTSGVQGCYQISTG